MSGYESSPCSVCGEESIIRRGTRPRCRMTPNCPGHHEPPIPEQLRRPQGAGHRVDDRPTSRLAARTQSPDRLSSTRLRVLEALRTHGAMTDHDLASVADLLLSSCSKRRGDCAKLGLVEEAGRGTSPSGSAATIWRITPAGLQALDAARSGGRRAS